MNRALLERIGCCHSGIGPIKAVRIGLSGRYIADSGVSVRKSPLVPRFSNMQLPSQAYLDIIPDHIDPIPIPETKDEARLLRRLMEENGLAVPRASFQNSGDRDLHGCTSNPGPCGS